MLWISAWLLLEPGRAYREAELDEVLRSWRTRFGVRVELDHVTLRRYLIDAGYLHRDAAGTSYLPAMTVPDVSHDPAIHQLDLDLLMLGAERARAARRQQFMRKGTP